MRNSPNIFHYARLYKKYWLLMVFIVAIPMILNFFAKRKEPVVYSSVVSVISSQRGEDQVSALGNIFGVQVSSYSQDVIFAILQSRSMRDDIVRHFNLEDRPDFWWRLAPYRSAGGFSVKVIGTDPGLTRDIANFSIENLDNINLELKITANKPMVRVLDPAVTGTPQPRATSKKVLFAGLFSFLICSLFIFSIDYLKRLKPQ